MKYLNQFWKIRYRKAIGNLNAAKKQAEKREFESDKKEEKKINKIGEKNADLYDKLTSLVYKEPQEYQRSIEKLREEEQTKLPSFIENMIKLLRKWYKIKTSENIFMEEYRLTLFKMLDDNILKEVLYRNRFELRISDLHIL